MGFILSLVAAHPWLLQAAEKTAEKSSKTQASGFQSYGMWILIAVMLVVFYVLLIRPQRKRAQDHDQMISKLKKGDEVVTIGGIQGVIKKMTDDTVVLEVDKGVRITFTRSAISRSITPVDEEEEEEEVEEQETEDLEGEEEEYEEELEEELEGETEEETSETDE
ncbi:MAG: preprotein translocase subunit YajC [Euryarchaeota archaeon]|nr:preprotein translocase subunit YajC [Euryarchaeota archaeon]